VRGRWIVVAILVVAAAACIKSPDTALERQTEAQRLSANLLVQFTKTDDASNRAVMADTDETSIAFAREAEQTTQAIQKDVDALGLILKELGLSNEARLLGEFKDQFAQYRALDHTVLELAVENTNLKAQRLSFGPAQEAADAFRHALQAVVPADPGKDAWRAKALVATAVMSVREMQVQHAPHIAEATDDVMTRLEKEMADSEKEARSTLKVLDGLASQSSRSHVDAAGAALDRFVSINAQIVSLSRRNTNVRSLALSLGQKRTLAAACETSLQALDDALGKHEFTATR
jgi:hypothetical protein